MIDFTWDNPSAAQVAAFGAVLQAFILVAALVVAKRQLEHAREALAAQDRPYVIVDFELHENNPHVADLVIRNIGRTAAHGVRFEFDPPIERAWEMEWLEETPLDIGISMLAPGRTLRVPFDELIERHKTQLPDLYEVRISYSGGGVLPAAEHTDPPYTLDLRTTSRLPAPWPKGLDEIAEALEKIERTMKRWSAVGGGGGLHVRSDADVDATMRQQLEGHGSAASEAPD